MRMEQERGKRSSESQPCGRTNETGRLIAGSAAAEAAGQKQKTIEAREAKTGGAAAAGANDGEMADGLNMGQLAVGAQDWQPCLSLGRGDERARFQEHGQGNLACAEMGL